MKNVLQYLENTERKLSDKIAVDDGQKAYTYHQLLDLAKRCGSALVRRTAVRKPVIVFMEKSADTLALFQGIAYAGCFYVLISPDFPDARTEKMLQVMAETEVAIAPEENTMKLIRCGFKGEIVTPEELFDEAVDAVALEEIRKHAREEDLLYGMFTSGSTGVPKSVVVSHKAVCDFIEDFVEVSKIAEQDVIGNQAPFDFDVSVKDIYSSFYTGAKLVLIPKTMFSHAEEILAYLKEKQVTVLIWAVAALCMVAGTKEFTNEVFGGIKKVLFSGEVMPYKQLKIWQNALPQAEFYNLYGPTEVTCNCTWYRVEHAQNPDMKLSIGRPFPKRKILLLDEEKKEISAVGAVGEICVGGPTLATGYYNNEEENAKRFVKMRLAGGLEELVYCTGDLGFYDEDGLLYFAGRKDFQIKRMGHRIELEEIELEIAKLSGVERVCCVYDAESQKLIAFYSGEKRDDIRRIIRKEIPAYMMPNRIVYVEKMPLNKNGKTDRAYLREAYDEFFRA